MSLPPPAHYFPFASGRYETTPGLMRLGKDFGNGPSDCRLLQLDQEFRHYRAAKLAARAEQLDKYYCTYNYSEATAQAVVALLKSQLLADYPDYFQALDQYQLYCQLTDEIVDLNGPDALDQLACQIQEDLAVVSCQGTDNWLAAVHVCCPNYWAPAAKIGGDFTQVHEPVPGMAKTNQASPQLVKALIEQGPYVRFGWGLATDTRLNHHSEAPQGIASSDWQGRAFQGGELFVRIERQVTWGLPKVNAFLFTIRTYFEEVLPLRHTALGQALRTAVGSMSPASLTYKGLDREALLAWWEEA